MKKLFLITICFLMSSFYVTAQTNEREAFQKFKKAREAYKNNNFADAANLLIETKNLLGSTNIRIQPMLIKSLVSIEDWRQAKLEVATYYDLKPDKELIEYQEILKIEKKIENEITEEEQLYSSAKRSKSVSQYQSYLDKYPYGKHRTEVQNRLGNQKDENAWEIANNRKSIASYYVYLESFPNGNYATTAIESIKVWDKEAYEKAIDEGTQEALNYYLNNYPRGKYRSTVRDKLTERKEYDVYMYAKNNNYIENYETYLKEYPNGKYASQIKNAIQVFKYNEAEKLYKNKNYRNAIRAYKNYIARFPYATNINQAKKNLRKAERQYKKYSSGYFGFSYESQDAIGITGGKLNKSKLGFYWNLRMTPEAFDIQFTEPETEISLNDLPDDSELGLVTFSMGWSYPVLYPVWLYVGGGITYQERFIKQEDENFFFKLENEDQLAFYPEAGINIRLSRNFVLIGGTAFVRDETLYKAGIGFNF